MRFLGDLFKGFANSWLAEALGWWIGLLYEWTSSIVNFLATYWMGLPPLAVGEGSATDRVTSSTAFLVPVIGLASTLFAVAKAGRADAENGQDVHEITTGLIRLFFVSAAGVTGTFMLMQFSSALAPWLFDVITFGAGEDRKLMSSAIADSDTDFLAGLSAAGYFFALPVMILAAMAQAAMAVGTDVGAAVLSAVLPLTASASVTAKGREAFAKQVGWILSCVAFKPAAAIIYGFGVALVNGSNIVPSASEEGSAGPFVSVLIGTMTLILAALTLPALVKLISPSASILGSGGGRFMAAAGGVAVGAGMTLLRMSGGSVAGSSSGASGASLSSSASGSSSSGSRGSSNGASGAAGALAGQKIAAVGQKISDGVKKAAASMSSGASGASGAESSQGSVSESAAHGAGSSSGGSSSSQKSQGASAAGASTAGASSRRSSNSSAGSTGTAGSSDTGASGTGSGPGGAPESSAPDSQASSSGGKAPEGSKTTPVGPRNKIAPASQEPKRENPSGAMGYKIQNTVRALAEDTEGAINPEGADQ